MTKQDQIKELAELDGWTDIENGMGNCVRYGGTESETIVYLLLPEYLTSYDTIIPLIQKQSKKVRDKVRYNLSHGCSDLDEHFDKMLTCTRAQLCEALLRATGKWVE